MKRVILHWKNPETGVEGHGKPISESSGEECIKHKEENPDGLDYWLAEGPPTEKCPQCGLSTSHSHHPGSVHGDLK